MNERLLRELSHITEEEQDILDGKTGIDRTLYSEGSDFVITSEKMLKEGRLIQFRPHTRFVYFPRHTHNYVEMIYMCSGSTRHLKSRISDYAIASFVFKTSNTNTPVPALQHPSLLKFRAIPLTLFALSFLPQISDVHPGYSHHTDSAILLW